MNHNPSGDSANSTFDVEEEIELEYEPINISRKMETPLVANHHDSIVEELALESIAEDDDDDSEILAEILQPAYSPTPHPDDSNPPSSGFIVISGFPTSETSFSAITKLNYAPLTVHGEDSSGFNSLDLNFTAGGQITPFRESYIPSAQELLRQIQPEVAPADPVTTPTETVPAPTKRQWATPIKLGSIAAACAIAGAGVYTALNPSILSPLAATKTTTVATTTTNLGQLIQSPNLAANEFTELNLSTLNTVKVATATPTTTVSTIANPVGAMTPTAIAFNPVNPQSITPPTALGVVTNRIQPKLADSLIKSLLPANFQAPQQPSKGVTR